MVDKSEVESEDILELKGINYWLPISLIQLKPQREDRRTEFPHLVWDIDSDLPLTPLNDSDIYGTHVNQLLAS